MINKTHKLLLGIFLLIIVDIIWVSSSELTKFLYQNENFDKPFFCTYFKTSMFTLYLLVLGLIAPWKNSCDPNRNNYTLVDQNVEDENFFTNGNSLSDSTYVPIKNGGGQVSGTESDDSSIKSVRFSKLAEVREMSSHDATEALMSRLSYSASMRIRRQKTNHKTARTALMFCVLWFIANYLFQLALEPNETALVLLLSSTSTFFTLILASIYPSSSGDRFTLSKLIAVFLCIAGVVMVTITDVQGPKMSKGVVLALLSAFFYASYLVLVKHKSDTEEKIDIPLFFGFVGLWNLLLMWPIFFVLNFTQIESFELPNQRQFIVLFLNGLIGTVLSEALWLWSCFLTSSLIGTIAMTLQIPLAMLFDVIFKSKTFSSLFYCGTIPMCGSLLFVGFLMRNEDSDPLWQLFKIAYRKLFLCRRPNIVRISDLSEQHESLISNYDN
ncbi:solute carrier family 35 member F5 [Contarinia nasturtii]|uniref:solute carrier family 35 member F5 n=1 Tax=Contarinia nasturtii TaxID=265458 RepID=UPI0012D3DFFB|nr:solute carrier family 35 member F5 [Contarinia nasturtii]XP_031616368.1 solute carrier family 35 member F5 [Contarinia nasturtii]